LTYDGQDISTDLKHVENLHRIRAVTNDDRVAEVIEECAKHGLGGEGGIPFDVIVTPLATGSPDYIEWVKLQTMKKEDDVAFYNMEAEAEIHGLDNHVSQISHVADRSAAESELLRKKREAAAVQLDD
jgi:hypothetical protein